MLIIDNVVLQCGLKKTCRLFCKAIIPNKIIGKHLQTLVTHFPYWLIAIDENMTLKITLKNQSNAEN